MSLKKSKTDKPVLVVGDVILDVYHFGSPIADSEGVRVGREDKTRYSWGGAGLLVRNLLELRQKVVFISILGSDAWGVYEKKWAHKNLTKCFVRERDRKTIVKERFVVEGKKAFKWNTLDNHALSRMAENRVFTYAKTHLARCRMLIISDYRHGLLSKPFAVKLLTLARKKGVSVVVDSQVSQRESNHRWYAGVDAFCLNEIEAVSIDKTFNGAEMEPSLRRLAATLQSTHLVVKRGEEGSVALIADKMIMSPAHPVTAVDPCGAGDAFLGALASCGFPPDEESLRFANFWAALSTTVVGAEPPKYVRH